MLYRVNSPLRDFKAQVFQAFAHPTRIAIVEALRDGEVGAGARSRISRSRPRIYRSTCRSCGRSRSS